MGIPSTELRIARKNTRAFIEADAIEVTIFRPVKVRNRTGGWSEGIPTEYPDQVFRLVPTSTRAGDQSYTTPDGHFDETRQELIGMPDAEVKKGDYFVLNNLTYDVTHRSPEDSYRVSCWVIQRGEDNDAV